MLWALHACKEITHTHRQKIFRILIVIHTQNWHFRLWRRFLNINTIMLNTTTKKFDDTKHQLDSVLLWFDSSPKTESWESIATTANAQDVFCLPPWKWAIPDNSFRKFHNDLSASYNSMTINIWFNYLQRWKPNSTPNKYFHIRLTIKNTKTKKQKKRTGVTPTWRMAAPSFITVSYTCWYVCHSYAPAYKHRGYCKIVRSKKPHQIWYLVSYGIL